MLITLFKLVCPIPKADPGPPSYLNISPWFRDILLYFWPAEGDFANILLSKPLPNPLAPPPVKESKKELVPFVVWALGPPILYFTNSVNLLLSTSLIVFIFLA